MLRSLVGSEMCIRDRPSVRRGSSKSTPSPRPQQRKWKRPWWEGRRLPKAARAQTAPAHLVQSPRRRFAAPRGPRALDSWHASIEDSCTRKKLSPEIRSKVQSLRWRSCDMFTVDPPAPPGEFGSLRTLSARRRETQALVEQASFDVAKSQAAREAFNTYSFEDQTIDLPGIRLALEALGVEVPKARHGMTELIQLKEHGSDLFPGNILLTQDDFEKMLKIAAIANQVDLHVQNTDWRAITVPSSPSSVSFQETVRERPSDLSQLGSPLTHPMSPMGGFSDFSSLQLSPRDLIFTPRTPRVSLPGSNLSDFHLEAFANSA
eukprot:TRINITY_DN44294_c0_g1_i1.p1 TRINITY_DN44294_c0_g1~~TRINITY_DN44294_c0_g1_i1.p1  ORF type:complete len:320 (+),score=69.69 TRINITY_DN44294_c0_g1_i1:153-1112(+)